METVTPGRVHALLIEDSDDDARILSRLADASAFDVHFERIADGEAAVAYLDAPDNAGEPQVILLDLSLPRIHGLEILKRLKSDARLADVPVIILSGSEDEEHIRQGRDLNAHTHIVKPMSLDEFTWIVQSIQAYWPRLQKLRALGAI